MSRIALAWLTALLTGFVAALPANAQQPLPSILYYERLESPELSFAGVALRVLGRQFELMLERNDALLHRLTSSRRNAVSDIELWKGTLAGLPGSWVRITRHGGVLSGAMWDGAELYVIEPYRSAAPRLVSPRSGEAGDTIVYLLTGSPTNSGDLVIPRDTQPSAVVKSGSVAPSEALSALPVSGVHEIDIGLIADPEYAHFATHALGSDALTELLSIANFLDGLFLSQVGVRIRPAELVVLDAEPDPFTSADPSILIGELEQYKRNNPALTPLGLAHLVTGRELQESGQAQIIGVANLNSLCDVARSVSLIQGTFGTAQSALIAAHEIGHNFGAPHDAEPGSACATAPSGFLMDANLSQSDEFSQCSIDQMLARISMAACLRPVPLSDVAVTSTATRTNVLTGWPYSVAFLVQNTGADDVYGIHVAVQTSPGAVLEEPEFPPDEGLQCEQDAHSRSCTLEMLPSGATIGVGMRLTAVQTGTVTTTATLTALNDSDPTNNVASFGLEALPAVELRASFEKSTEMARPGQLVDVAIRIVNEGVVDATGVEMWLVLPTFFELASATLPQGGSCELWHISRWRCPIGTMPIGQPQVVDLRLRTLDLDTDYGYVETEFLDVTLSALEPVANEGWPARTRFDATQVFADFILTVDGPQVGTRGELAVFTFDVENLGPDPIPSMRLSFRNSGIVIESSDSPGAACVIDEVSDQVRCDIHPVAPGEIRSVSISGNAPKIGSFKVAYALSGDTYAIGGSHFEDEYEWVVFSRLPAPAPPSTPSPPAPAPPTQTGAGGGGAIDAISLLLALMATGIVLRKINRRALRERLREA